MRQRTAQRFRLALGAGATAAMTALGVASPGVAHASTVPAGDAVPHASSPAWTGSFTGIPGSTWKSAWGELDQGAWGFDNDTVSSGALKVKYGKGSSSNSCTDCPTDGGTQFYTDLRTIGLTALTTSRTLDLKYQVMFPAGHDFGHGGKLPGLFGGTLGEESGGNHGTGWSARFMWREPSKGELYFYSPTADGYGKDLGLGKWMFAADGTYHTMEMLVDRGAQTTTIWYDGHKVYSTSTTGIKDIPFRGIFFSTFYGGHDTTWGPSKTDYAYFRSFSLSTSVQH